MERYKRYFVIQEEETKVVCGRFEHFPKLYIMWNFRPSECQNDGISFASEAAAQGFANLMPDDDVKVVCEERVY